MRPNNIIKKATGKETEKELMLTNLNKQIEKLTTLKNGLENDSLKKDPIDNKNIMAIDKHLLSLPKHGLENDTLKKDPIDNKYIMSIDKHLPTPSKHIVIDNTSNKIKQRVNHIKNTTIVNKEATKLNKENVYLKLLIYKPGDFIVKNQCYIFNEDDNIYQVYFELRDIHDKYIKVYDNVKLIINMPMKKDNMSMTIVIKVDLDKKEAGTNIVDCSYYVKVA